MRDVKSESIKVVLKVYDPALEKTTWVHFCYIEKELYLQYLRTMDITSNDLNEIISGWVKEKFKVNLSINSTEDLDVLKGFVRNYYKETYPELYIDSTTDNQGWMRVWVTKCMKEDLEDAK